jgi:hypothetical protein
MAGIPLTSVETAGDKNHGTLNALLESPGIFLLFSHVDIDFHHTIKDGRRVSGRQSLLEYIKWGTITSHGEIELYKGSKDFSECYTDACERSDVGLDQKRRQQEP